MCKKEIIIYVTGCISYGSTYLLRKPVSVVKSDMQKELGLSIPQLGWLDAALMLTYVTSQVFCSRVSDRYSAGLVTGLSLVIAAVSMVCFGMTDIYLLLLALMAFNGFFQGLCWPSCCKVVSSWCTSTSRNTVFGVLGMSSFLGAIISNTLSVYLQKYHGWRSVFFTPSVIVILIAIPVIIIFKEQSSLVSANTKDIDQKLSWCQLWTICCVKEVTVTLFCVKSVRYAIYMWLPIYLHQHIGLSNTEAGLVSTVFDAGGVLGSLLVGLVINRLFQGDGIRGCSMLIWLSAFSMTSMVLIPNYLCLTISLVIAGATNCAADCLLGGSVPTEIGEKTGEGLGASVTGLVNGAGTLGSVLQGPMIGYLVRHFNWPAMTYFLVTMATLAACLATMTSRKQVSQKPLTLV